MAKAKKSSAVRTLEALVGEPLTLARYLRSIREGEEETQAEFSKRLGITASHLSDIERGTKTVSVRRAVEWADRLGYSQSLFVQLAIEAELESLGLNYTVKLGPAA